MNYEYVFTVTLIGYGNTPEEAWEDAIKALSISDEDDPGFVSYEKNES